MAFTIFDFCGFESGGLEEVVSGGGSPDATEATTVRNGDRSCKVVSNTDEFELVFSGGVQNDYIVGFAVRFTNLAPSTEYRFWGIRDAGTSWVVQFYLETDGDLRIVYTQDGTSTTVTTPFTANQWHFIEVKVNYHATTGSVVTYLDDSQIANDTGLDTVGDGTQLNVSRWWGPTAGTIYFDDIYMAVSATGVSDFLGSGVNIPRCYQNTVEDATDQGSTLDTGTWAGAGERPVSDETPDTDAAEYSNNKSGYTLTDTADSNARPGPSGGPTIDTIKAGKWFIRAERGNGAASTHNHIYGHNGDADQSTSLSLGATPANYFHTAEASAAYVPTSSETFAHGFEKSGGGREMYVHELMAFLLTVDATGTQYNQSVAGTITPSGIITKQTGKGIVGTFTSSGIITKQTGKGIAGIFTSSGTIAKQMFESLTGTFSSSGTLATSFTKLLTLTGTLTSSGILTKQTGKGLVGTFTSSGTVIKQTGKGLVGTFTSSGILTKQTGKGLVGTFTSSGTLVTSFTKLLTLVGTFTSSGILTKQTGKGLAGTLTTAGTIVKQTGKNLVGTFTSSGTLDAVKQGVGLFFQTVEGTFTSSGTLVKQTGKGLTGTLTTAGTLVKQTGKGLTGTFSSSGTLVTSFTRLLTLVGTFTSSGTLTKQTQKLLQGTLTTAGTLVKQTEKTLAGALTTAGTLIKQTRKQLKGTLTTSGIIASLLNPITDTIGLTLRARDYLVTLSGRSFSVTVLGRTFTIRLRNR